MVVFGDKVILDEGNKPVVSESIYWPCLLMFQFKQILRIGLYGKDFFLHGLSLAFSSVLPCWVWAVITLKMP